MVAVAARGAGGEMVSIEGEGESREERWDGKCGSRCQ